MLQAKIAKVDVAHGLPGNALSPMGSEAKLEEYQVPWILPGVCAFFGATAGNALRLGQEKSVLLGKEGRITLGQETRIRRWAQRQGFCPESVRGSRMSGVRASLWQTHRVGILASCLKTVDLLQACQQPGSSIPSL